MKYKLNLEEIDTKDIDLSRNPAIVDLIATGIFIAVEEKEWPQKGDQYFCVKSSDAKTFVGTFSWQNDEVDRFLKGSGNLFRTCEEAETYRDQILSKSL